jgi:hypothetical protein
VLSTILASLPAFGADRERPSPVGSDSAPT